MGYVQERAQYEPNDEIEDKENVTILNISGTELRRRLAEGLEIPEWFSFPEVVQELRRTRPPRSKQGFTVFFTGLSGSGKSTIANIVEKKLAAIGKHTYLLDGDNVRHGLNKDLGFTDADRVENIRRVAEVSKLMLDSGLLTMVSFISPFRSDRRMARQLFGKGEFLEIYVETPLEVAEERDVKGLYKKARAGEIKHFTGIDSPYEPPKKAEISVNTVDMSAEQSADAIIIELEKRGII